MHRTDPQNGVPGWSLRSASATLAQAGVQPTWGYKTTTHRTDPQFQSFGSLIREYRLASGLTQEELAERAGISVRSVSDLERGLYQVPHRDTVARLADALGLTADAAKQLEAAIVRQRGPVAASAFVARSRGASVPSAPELPTGIVTFLSVEGSDMTDELLNASVERFQGVSTHPPDGEGRRMLVFRTATQAVAAAVELQRARLLRVALYTGEADVRDGQYYGSAINRCVRLRSLAGAGQTLVSQAVSELAGGSLPTGAGLRYFGDHHLSDFAPPERIFELTSSGSAVTAAPVAPASLDAHYDTILRGLIDGRVVLFAGDAINLYGRAGSPAVTPGLRHPPTADEVAASLAGRFDYPHSSNQSLSRVAQYVSTMAGSGPLFEELHRIFDADYRPTPLHDLLATLPTYLASHTDGTRSHPLIVSSSFDDALERAFASASQPFDLVFYVAEGELRGRFVHRPSDGRPRVIDKPNKYAGLAFDKRPVILKVHGTTDRSDPDQDSFAVTEDHFPDYLTGGDLANLIPVTIAAKLRRSHFLFLGYGLRDWNLRVILRRLWGEQRLSYKSWAVHFTAPDGLERGLWRDRGVDVLDVRLDEYLEGLRARLTELRPGSATA